MFVIDSSKAPPTKELFSFKAADNNMAMLLSGALNDATLSFTFSIRKPFFSPTEKFGNMFSESVPSFLFFSLPCWEHTEWLDKTDHLQITAEKAIYVRKRALNIEGLRFQILARGLIDRPFGMNYGVIYLIFSLSKRGRKTSTMKEAHKWPISPSCR